MEQKHICLWTILFKAQVPMRKIDSPQGQQTHHRDPLHGPSPWTMSRLTADIERFPHRKRELSTGHVWEIAPRLLQHGANHGKREPIFHVHNQRYFCGIPRSFLWSSANFQLNHLVDGISQGFPSPLERMAQLWSHSPLRRRHHKMTATSAASMVFFGGTKWPLNFRAETLRLLGVRRLKKSKWGTHKHS